MIALDTSETPIASVIILSHESLPMLADCLSSIAQSVDGRLLPFEVIVLFWQMSPNSVEEFAGTLQGVRTLQVPLNLGFGGGNNHAAQRARGEYLVFLNDDTIVKPGWLESLVETAQKDTNVGAVGSRLIFPNGTLQEAGAILWSDASCYPLGREEPAGSLAYSYLRAVDYASANGLLVRRESFERAGGFDGRFFPGYYEDVDLCLTIRHELGQKVLYDPRSVIVHRESVTMNRDPDFRAFLFRRHRRALQEKWGEALPSYPAARPDSPAAVEEAVMRASGARSRVLVVDDRVPQASMGSGFGRTADLLAELRGAGYAVAFYPSDRGANPDQNPLAEQGVDLVVEPLNDHLARPEKRYDAVIISRPHNFQHFFTPIRATMPKASIVYDAEALYHRRLWLQAEGETEPGRRSALEAEAASMEALEAHIARSADRLVTISETEFEWLQTLETHAPIEFLRPLANIRLTTAGPQERSDAVYVAGWLAGESSPNVAALRWYAEAVHPRVRALLPSFRLHVTGARPPLSVQLMEGDGVVLAGHVESVERLYGRARLAIAPTLVGAGVKIKTVEALQYGVPVVATSVGADGLGLSDGAEIDVADDPAEFARRIVALVANDALWLQRRESAQERIAQWGRERVFWPDIVSRALDDRANKRAAR